MYAYFTANYFGCPKLPIVFFSAIMSKLRVNFNCATWVTYLEKVLMPAFKPSTHQAFLVLCHSADQHLYKTKVSN